MRESEICIGGLKGCYQKAIDDDDEKTILDLEPNLNNIDDDDFENDDYEDWGDWDDDYDEGEN